MHMTARIAHKAHDGSESWLSGTTNKAACLKQPSRACRSCIAEKSGIFTPWMKTSCWSCKRTGCLLSMSSCRRPCREKAGC